MVTTPALLPKVIKFFQVFSSVSFLFYLSLFPNFFLSLLYLISFLLLLIPIGQVLEAIGGSAIRVILAGSGDPPPSCLALADLLKDSGDLKPR